MICLYPTSHFGQYKGSNPLRIKSEISENTQRKDFSLEEIIQIKKAVEPEIKKESEKRMLSGKPSAKFDIPDYLFEMTSVCTNILIVMS